MAQIDFQQYHDPGVYVEEIPSPTTATPIITPTVIALVGDSQRYQKGSEVVQLTGTTPVQLKQLGILLTSIVVTDAVSGVIYTLTTDYTRAAQNGADATPATSDDTTTITRVGAGGIASGAYVRVTYTYTNPGYYDATAFDDFDSIKEKYGEPFDSQGLVNSELSLAAFIAMKNGASSLVCVAVQAAGATPTTNEWSAAINKLVDRQDVNVIVPVEGTETVHDLVFAHVNQMALSDDFRRAFVGQDGTTSPISSTTYIAQASSYRSSRMVIVAPSVFRFYEGNTASFVNLGGQYAAAAVAGLHAAQAVQEPLTRKNIVSFYEIPTQLTAGTLVELQRQGILVLHQHRNGSIGIRHGLTTVGPTGNKYTQEISVVAGKDRLHQLLQDTLDNQGLVGSLIEETTPDFVEGTVVGALEVAKDSRLIADYTNVNWRLPIGTPTVIEIRFEYQPSMPLNYVLVKFALDTDTGNVSFDDIENTNDQFVG